MNLGFPFLVVTLAWGTLSEFAQETKRHVKYEEKWFETKVDHYGFMNNDRFMLRYLYSNEYYKPGGPVFFYPGNEGEIEDFARNTGFLWEFAPQFGAEVLFVEHRYYGKSLPYKNASKDARLLNYLTVEQAMSDFIDLLSTLFPNRKVIAFGGSYGGMLAAWMRTRYPEYITGALASSAPVYQYQGLSDCSGPYNVVTSRFGSYFERSPSNIKQMWNIMGNKSDDNEYVEYLWKRLNLCQRDNKTKNMKYIFDYFELMLFNVVMVNYPTEADLLVPLPPYPAYLLASFFSKRSMEVKDYEDALAVSMDLYFNYTGRSQGCYDLSTTNGVIPDDIWSYQYCTEMDMNICSKESENNMFRPFATNNTEDSNYCQNKFGVSPDPNWLTREFNVGDMSSLSNIIFANAEYDPWMPGGVLEDVNDSVIAIYIYDAAHHVDLRFSTPYDPPSVVDAREREVEIISQWLMDKS